MSLPSIPLGLFTCYFPTRSGPTARRARVSSIRTSMCQETPESQSLPHGSAGCATEQCRSLGSVHFLLTFPSFSGKYTLDLFWFWLCLFLLGEVPACALELSELILRESRLCCLLPHRDWVAEKETAQTASIEM